jgi:hypothetical protein
VQEAGGEACGRGGRQNARRNRGYLPVLSSGLEPMAFSAAKRRHGRSWALVAGACLLAALVAAAATPGAVSLAAPLRVVVLGRTPETPVPSCPGKIVRGVEITPCRVEGHVTGFQVKAGGVSNPYEAPFEGKIVAWSIALSKPSTKDSATTTNEVGFFDEFLGQPAEARIGVLRPVRETNPPQYTLVRQSPIEVLNPYFGGTPIFALDHPLTVLQGQVVALTVPTWAPMFAFNVEEENTWRGSRLPKHCTSKEDIQGGHPQQVVGKTKTYGCFYSNARLLYTATLVKKP